jgi:hypothetical protein
MLVYIEYISPKPSASLDEFHDGACRQEAWSDEHGDDQLVLNLGRNFRLGPEPAYLAVWYTSEGSLERLGDWERIFRSGEADHLEEPFQRVARIDHAGCYEPLLEPVARRGALYYAEFFDPAAGASPEDVRRLYEERRERHPELGLDLLVDRIGKLGPDPRGLAVWSMDSWSHLGAIAADTGNEADSAIRVETVGVYRDLGHETI